MVACQGGFSLAALSPGAASFLSTQHEELMFQSGRLHADSFFSPQQNPSHIQHIWFKTVSLSESCLYF